MRFLELLERAKGRGVVMVPTPQVVPTPSSAASAQGMPVGEVRPTANPEITGICEDSRKVKAGDLFVARGGTKTEGTKFIGDAHSRGAVAVIFESSSPGIAFPGLTDSIAVARVANANLAAAILAHELAGNPTAHMKMIGITGTKGKTTVAYLLRSVLKAAGHKVGMIGTVEIDDGAKVVPAEMTTPGAVELVDMFSQMKAHGVTHCVMEVSSHALHQHRVAGIDWAVAIFTNLTGDHLDYHGTMENYAAAKAMLFEGLKEGAVAVVNADDKWMGRLVDKCLAKVVKFNLVVDTTKAGTLECAPHAGDDWSGLVTYMGSDGMWINLGGPDVYMPHLSRSIPYMYNLPTPLVGRHNAYNLTSVLTAAYALGLRGDELRRGVGALLSAQGAPGRLQAVIPDGCKLENMPFQVFVDYAHTHDALENVLTALRATMGARKRKGKIGPGGGVEVIGGTPMPRLICMFGGGGDRDRTKRPKMGEVAQHLADVVIVTSDNPRTENPAAIIDQICAGFSPDWQHAGNITIEPDRRAAIKLAIGMATTGDVVLLAGKGHENYQIIGTTKHHFDDVEEAENALREVLIHHQDTKTQR